MTNCLIKRKNEGYETPKYIWMSHNVSIKSFNEIKFNQQYVNEYIKIVDVQ